MTYPASEGVTSTSRHAVKLFYVATNPRPVRCHRSPMQLCPPTHTHTHTRSLPLVMLTSLTHACVRARRGLTFLPT